MLAVAVVVHAWRTGRADIARRRIGLGIIGGGAGDGRLESRVEVGTGGLEWQRGERERERGEESRSERERACRP